ncbi:MAG: RIP metalloprotease RseP [Gammaproteobacteria bacterium]|nr:RIP metalloprotease RseP [Gammaproteobacteria bacterium]
MELLHTLFFFILAIGILVSFHEFGHFWVARKTGVKVLRFSVGFGKVLWSRQKSPEDTEYVISAIPLGGYVKMVDEREGPVKPEDLPYAFNRQPLWVRTAIVSAGPAFNIMLAITLFWGVLVIGETGLRPVLGEMKPGTLAQAAGFVEGEEILAVNDKLTPTWTDAMTTLITLAMDGEPNIRVKVKNSADEQAVKELHLGESDTQDSEKLYDRLGFTPKLPNYYPVVAEVFPDSAAQAAGLKKDDAIISADGTEFKNVDQWIGFVKKKPGTPVKVIINRQGAELALTVTPKSVSSESNQPEGKIGAAMTMPKDLLKTVLVEHSLPPLEAIPAALTMTYDNAITMLKMMGKMFIGKVSVKNLSGPIGIAKIAGQSATISFVAFIRFMALVSVSLGVLNLLPIPVLDGGHLMFFGIEAVKGSPIPEKVQLFFQQIGMALLFLLMATAMVVDIQRWFD